MPNLDEAIKYVEKQLRSDGEQKQSFNRYPQLPCEIRLFSYGKCELIKLLSFIYEVPQKDVNIKK